MAKKGIEPSDDFKKKMNDGPVKVKIKVKAKGKIQPSKLGKVFAGLRGCSK